MSRTFNFLDRLQARTALLAIGPATLRNQGAPGVVLAARKYLRAMNLKEFSVRTRSHFEETLERHTQQLMKCFPDGARHNWGAARKALNIFLRDVVYNRPLSMHYRLLNLEPWLELPLDRNSYDGLAEDSAKYKTLTRWPRVKGLDAQVSAELQAAAQAIATCLHTRRIHLDVKYWRKKAIDDLKGSSCASAK